MSRGHMRTAAPDGPWGRCSARCSIRIFRAWCACLRATGKLLGSCRMHQLVGRVGLSRGNRRPEQCQGPRAGYRLLGDGGRRCGGWGVCGAAAPTGGLGRGNAQQGMVQHVARGVAEAAPGGGRVGKLLQERCPLVARRPCCPA